MQVVQIGVVYGSSDPTAAGGWFAEHLGFQILVDLGWYVSTQSSDRDELRVDFVRHDHETWVERTDRVRGAMVALVVEDVDDHHDQMVDGRVQILKPLVTEPWGQRRFQVAGPDGLVIELVQPVEPDLEWMAAQGLLG